MTVSADEAYVIVIPDRFYGPTGPERLSHEDRDDVLQNLVDLGIGEDDVEFESGQEYDPETISVEVQIEDLPEIGDLILDAVEDVVRRQSAVEFILASRGRIATRHSRQPAKRRLPRPKETRSTWPKRSVWSEAES